MISQNLSKRGTAIKAWYWLLEEDTDVSFGDVIIVTNLVLG